MSERRKIGRLSPLVIRAEFPRGEAVCHGYLTNLSEGGAFLATDDDVPVAEILHLHFVLPWNLGEHDADASVKWRTRDMGADAESMPTGVGLSFPELNADAQKGIRLYMHKFQELLEQIEREGVNEVLEKLTKETSGTETVH